MLPASSHQSKLPWKTSIPCPTSFRLHLHGREKKPPEADSRAHSQPHWRHTHARSGPFEDPSLSSWPWSPPLSAHPETRKSPHSTVSLRKGLQLELEGRKRSS